MKPVNEIIESTGNTKNQALTSADMTKPQSDAVVYFFQMLKALDPDRFASLYPDEKTEKVVMRTNARYIMDFTKEAIDKGFHEIRLARQAADMPKDLRFWKIDQIIGWVKSGGMVSGGQAGSYKIFKPGLPVTEEVKAKRDNAALGALDEMKAMLDKD